MTTLGVFRDDFYPISVALPNTLVSTISQASGTIPAANVAAADEVYLTQSGATALTLPTAASVIAAAIATLQANGIQTPNVVGMNWYLRIINTNAGTLTLTAGTGNTITGTATLATNTTRDFIVTITSNATVTYASVGTGTNS